MAQPSDTSPASGYTQSVQVEDDKAKLNSQAEPCSAQGNKIAEIFEILPESKLSGFKVSPAVW